MGRNLPRAWPSPCSPDSEPPKLHDQLGGLVHKRLELFDPLRSVQVEADPAVDAALAEMPVERGLIAIFVEQLTQLGQVGADLVGRHGGVFPARPTCRAARNPGGGTQSALAHFPDHLFLRGSSISFMFGTLPCFFSASMQSLRLTVGILFAVAAELDHEEASAGGKECQVGRLVPLLPDELEQQMVETLQGGRFEREDFHQVVTRLVHVGIAQNEQRARGRIGDQVHRRFEDGDQRAFRTDQCPSDVEVVLGQQLVGIVAGDAPRQLRKTPADLVGIFIAECLEFAVQFAARTTLPDDLFQFLGRRRADAQAHSVVPGMNRLRPAALGGGPVRIIPLHRVRDEVPPPGNA